VIKRKPAPSTRPIVSPSSRALRLMPTSGTASTASEAKAIEVICSMVNQTHMPVA
jgi:hypothetical protein